MSRRVATITLNPAYDLVGYTPEIERGEVNPTLLTIIQLANALQVPPDELLRY